MYVWIALSGAIFWFLFVAVILRSKSSPEAQIRRRLQILIDNAESARLERQKLATKNNSATADGVLNEQIKNSAQKTFFERVIHPLINKISENVQSFAPAQIKAMFERQIFLAGKQGIWNVKRLVLMWIVSVTGGTVIGFLVTNYVEYHFLQETLILIFGGVIGAVLPFLRLQSMIRTRKKRIRRQLPEFLDLLLVSVQAGLSFDGAVAKISGRMKGPLIDEFKRMQNDVSLGMTHRYSLTQMARRCDIEEIYLFTTSIIQAEKLGTSMSRTLKLQADNIRDRHRQYVKAQALKAPVKIIFPMVLFIFPSIFVVLLFPSIIMLIKTLGNH